MPSLYDFPQIYDLFFRPDEDLWTAVTGWIDRYLDGPPRSVLDPACGPGNWLLPCAQRYGCRVAGNDIRPGSVARAQELLGETPQEFLVGDMRDLDFQSGPFDLALNFDSSIGHLPDNEAVIQHLQAVGRNLRPGGLYLLGLTILQGIADEACTIPLFESGVMQLPQGGRASVRYYSLWRSPKTNRECIRLQLSTQGVAGAPPLFQEEYELLTFDEAGLRDVLARSGGWEVRAMHSMIEDGFPVESFSPGCRAVTLALIWQG